MEITRRSFLALLTSIPLLDRLVSADRKEPFFEVPYGFVRERWLIWSETFDPDSVSFEYVLMSPRGDTLTMTTGAPIGGVGDRLWVSRREIAE